MTDYAKLVLAVDSTQARLASLEMNNLARNGARAETATSGLSRTMAGFATSLLSTAVAGAALNKAISVQRQFDTINAGLITATGSAERAALAFDALSGFAATTPYDLAQVTEGYIKLVNLGLDPSERAMRSYGNTASAMAKDLNLMIEAVADAATGEFERLKEFGIKAKSEGDNVSLTFKGVTTTIGKNAREIEEYLIKLGENNFADAMGNRMASLDGKLSNLSDSWDAMFRGIMGSSIGDGVEGMVDVALSALDGLNGYLAGGEFEGHIEAMGAAFTPFANDVQEAMSIIVRAVQESDSEIQRDNAELLEFMIDAWMDFPENIRAIVQIAAVHFAHFIERVKIGWQVLNDFREASKDGWGGKTWGDAFRDGDAALASANSTLEDSIDLIYKERDATQSAQAAAAKKAAADRAEYDRKKNQKPEWITPDRPNSPARASDSAAKAASDAAAKRQKADLDQLRKALQTEEEEIASSYAEREATISASLQRGSAEQVEMSRRSIELRDKELQELADARNREFKGLQNSLMSEEEAIQASYDARIQIINDNVLQSEEARARLREKVEADRNAELAALAQAEQSKRMMLYQGLMTEQEEIVAYHEQRKQIILNATLATEKERQELLRREETRFISEQLAREKAKAQEYMGATAGFFGAMSQLMTSFGKASDKDAKKRWKMAQNFAIAQAVVSTAAGIAKALEKGFPLSLIEGAAAAATGAAQIAAIKSQTYSGSYDLGGQIPAGKWGWVGEAGPEKVRGPATVTGRKVSERSSGAAGGNVTSIVNVHLDGNGSVKQTDSSVNGQGDTETARELGNVINAKVNEALVQHQRPGGILWRMNNG